MSDEEKGVFAMVVYDRSAMSGFEVGKWKTLHRGGKSLGGAVVTAIDREDGIIYFDGPFREQPKAKNRRARRRS